EKLKKVEERSMGNRLENKVILVTGAGGGMGRVAGELFTREGAAVGATGILPEAVEEAVSVLGSAGRRVVGVPGNVAVAVAVRRAISQGLRALVKLDVLDNNAGIRPAEDTSVQETSDDVYQQVLDVILLGVRLCCKYGIPELLKAGGGSV